MIQEQLPTWPARMMLQANPSPANTDPNAYAAELGRAIAGTVAALQKAVPLPDAIRALATTDALAIFLVQYADAMPGDGPFICRLEWLLNHLSERAWQIQLARRIPSQLCAATGPRASRVVADDGRHAPPARPMARGTER